MGDDPLGEVLPVLRPAVDEAVPGLDGGVVADALVGALARHYRCEQPGDVEVLERIGFDVSGNALESLAGSGTLSSRDVLRVGLKVLSALAKLCMNGSASILTGSPEQGAA